jgi:hypothetical protein
MRWLVLCLLVCLVVLLVAAAAMAIHVLIKRHEIRRMARESVDPIEEIDLKPEV